jgi:hypothetical protein
MSKLTSHEIRLASRPEGIPAATNFTLVRTELEPLQDGEVLVRNLFMSVDPYMRGRMNEVQSYVPPFELGKPLDGGAVGEVVESRANEFRVRCRYFQSWLAGILHRCASPGASCEMRAQNADFAIKNSSLLCAGSSPRPSAPR